MIAIIGAGGLAREIASYLKHDRVCKNPPMFVDDRYVQSHCRPISELDIDKFEVIVAIGDPWTRQKIVESLPKETNYFTFIHSSVIIRDDVNIGLGSCVCPGCIISVNIAIGRHAVINTGTTVGHDCTIGDFFTASPQACLSGSCQLGSRVYLGTNASVREKVNICSDVTIGMHSCVIKTITSPGTYIGCPTKKLREA